MASLEDCQQLQVLLRKAPVKGSMLLQERENP